MASKTDTSYQNLMSENNDALVLISELETKISNLENDLKKSNVNGDSLDTTILETKLLELDEANEKVSTLELKVSNLVDSFQEKDKLISSLNTDIRLSKEMITIYESLNVKGWRKTSPILKLKKGS